MKATTLLLAIIASSLIAIPSLAQTQQTPPKLSDKETAAMKAIAAAPNLTAKLTAIGDFIKKFPKSKARETLLSDFVNDVLDLKDFAQAVTLSERAQKIFTNEDEQDQIRLILLNSYTNSGQSENAFRVGTEMLAKDAEDVHALAQLSFMGAEEVRRNKNTKFAQQSLQYGSKAIELIEANKKPAKMDDANWALQRQRLSQLYQENAILNSSLGNTVEAKARALKATVVDPKDPSAFALLGVLINMEYTEVATKYPTMAAGEAKQQALRKAQGLIDEMIDAYAHVMALSAGHPEYQALAQQVSVDLTTYYKFRHNQSTEGLQQLIDKYKP